MNKYKLGKCEKIQKAQPQTSEKNHHGLSWMEKTEIKCIILNRHGKRQFSIELPPDYVYFEMIISQKK